MTVNLALVACLDEARSVHSVTFKRACAVFELYAAAKGINVTLTRYNDGADATLAATIAQQIVLDRPHAVIGHFASAAADAAAPIYAMAALPLYLPAATARHLARHATTYRICAHDDAYAQAVAGFCQEQGLHIVRIEHDGSVHGRSMAMAMPMVHDVPAGSRACVLYIGNCSNTIKFLAMQRDVDNPVVLTDDALAPDMLAPARAYPGEVFVVGIVPRPTGDAAEWMAAAFIEEFGHEPGCYFWETIAAMQVAIATAGIEPGAGPWNTVLGPLYFDAQGEGGQNTFTLFRVAASGFERVVSCN